MIVLSVVIVSLTRVACIEAASIGSTCTKNDYTATVSTRVAIGTSIRSVCIKNADWNVLLMWPNLSDSKSACIGVASIAMACIRSAYTGAIFVSGSGAVKCLGIYL